MPILNLTKFAPIACAFSFYMSAHAVLAQPANSNAGGNGNGNGNAFGLGNRAPTSATPEIDASSGLLAIAAVAAILALAYVLRHRRAKDQGTTAK